MVTSSNNGTRGTLMVVFIVMVMVMGQVFVMHLSFSIKK
jgi:hypothetical protein